MNFAVGVNEMEKLIVTLYDRNSRPVGSAERIVGAGWDWCVYGQNITGRSPKLVDVVTEMGKELGRDVCVPLDVAGIVRIEEKGMRDGGTNRV